ncbi:unnamed protein product [Orchesella dallaii]|uniref:Transcriptional regulatory protein n=1 Tax=Orchesella dallaii TaxID=48710 RepID=A0ABP1RN66_9HEXA
MNVLGQLSRKAIYHNVLPSHHSIFSSSKSRNVGSCALSAKLFDNFKILNSPHPPVPTVVNSHQPFRNAGHSKWANIKHTKAANDQAKSAALGKYVNFMRVAVKEHGSADPKLNPKLAQVIAQVKEAKLPMAAIERQLQALQAKKDSQQSIYPIRGPGSCFMLIDMESPNVNKTKQEINTILRKNNGKVTDDSILFMFDHKGILLCSEFEGKPASETLLDDATMHAIEAGANDVEFHKEHPEFGTVLEFTTAPTAFLKVKNALEELKYEIVYADVSYFPKQCVELEDEDFEAANKLYSKLTEHSDVTNVYVNIA